MGQPVVSVHHLTDMMVYRLDLPDYVAHELQESQMSVPLWRDYRLGFRATRRD